MENACIVKMRKILEVNDSSSSLASDTSVALCDY